MDYLRKISRGKWPQESQIAQATLKDILADTVVAELKTDNNCLSVWKIETDEDLEDAFIALGSSCDHFCTLSAVRISQGDLRNISISTEEGITPTIGINQKHRNLCSLSFCSLGTVIKSIIYSLRKGKFIRKTKPVMKKLLVDAYKRNKLDMASIASSLKDEIIEEIRKEQEKALRQSV